MNFHGSASEQQHNIHFCEYLNLHRFQGRLITPTLMQSALDHTQFVNRIQDDKLAGKILTLLKILSSDRSPFSTKIQAVLLLMLDLDRMFAPDSQGVHRLAGHESLNWVVHLHRSHHDMTMLWFFFSLSWWWKSCVNKRSLGLGLGLEPHELRHIDYFMIRNEAILHSISVNCDVRYCSLGTLRLDHTRLLHRNLEESLRKI